TRRALETRDRHCVFTGCNRPLNWCDGHHLVWWTKGGSTTLPNLALLCRPHHRMVHEEGWTLERHDGRFRAKPPERKSWPARGPPERPDGLALSETGSWTMAAGLGIRGSGRLPGRRPLYRDGSA